MTTSQSARQTAAVYRHEAIQRGDAPPPAPNASENWRFLLLPAVLALLVGSFAFFTREIVLERTFLGAAAALLIWCAALAVGAQRAGRALSIEVVRRPQHWVQALGQGSLFLYWASYNHFVFGFFPFILAELLFAYAIDSLLSWSRRDRYTLGFGPFPVIFSISLFLLFKPHWFYFQFALIALGFLAKELIRWKKDGRSAHIFNPSSFPLAVVSAVLLFTGTTSVTYGNVIANSVFDTPHVHLFIFFIALAVQLLFGVARMTMAAAVTLYLLGLAYLAATGTYLFYDAYIPAAVFIGMTLLMTDPSTAPKTGVGRLMFGALYALGTAFLFIVLERFGAPTFYDKLLPVPIMNLMVRGIDRVARSGFFTRFDPSLRKLRALPQLRRNAIYTSVWAATFAILYAVHGVGDVHPGQYLPFWHQACGAGSSRACTYTAKLTQVYCARGSGWACNEVGALKVRLGRDAAPEFHRACDLGFNPGCENVQRPPGNATAIASAPPAARDLPIVLSGTKPPLRERDPATLYALACKQGWPGACEVGAQ
jgi:hypothetical protein